MGILKFWEKPPPEEGTAANFEAIKDEINVRVSAIGAGVRVRRVVIFGSWPTEVTIENLRDRVRVKLTNSTLMELLIYYFVRADNPFQLGMLEYLHVQATGRPVGNPVGYWYLDVYPSEAAIGQSQYWFDLRLEPERTVQAIFQQAYTQAGMG